MFANAGLRLRTLVWVALYTVLLSLAVVIHGYFVNEHAEELLWESLLRFELQHFIERRASDPAYRWDDAHGLQLYEGQGPAGQPERLRHLPDGLHDELLIDGHEYVVLVRHVDGMRYVLTLDITKLEADEHELIYLLIGSAVVMVVAFGLLIAWILGRTVQPLVDMAARIARLQPDQGGQRIHVGPDALPELRVIASALNAYLERNEQFVERERAFIDSASHELRTPVAVIAGSSLLALQQPLVPLPVQMHLERIRDSARGVEDLIALLLVLAKDPARMAGASDRLALADVVPGIVEDHRHLARGKNLTMTVAPIPECHIEAPLPIVQSAIGNLLRNAIENSDQGEIGVKVEADATLVIVDPGHGMSPEEVAAIYARMARGRARDGGGIGLALLARLCEHLGWELAFRSMPRQGTTTVLRFRPPHRHPGA